MARLLIVCTFALGMPLPASADIVTTDQIYASAERDRVRNFLDRTDVQTQMQRLGVDRKQRVLGWTHSPMTKPLSLQGISINSPPGAAFLAFSLRFYYPVDH